MKLDLIDEYRLFVHPVILGAGKPMFHSPNEQVKLQLVETRVFDCGVVLLRYQRGEKG